MSNNKIRVVITGASGFIGTRIVEFLSSQMEVHVIPVTRQCIPNWHRVSDYSMTPSGDILIHLAENSDRGQVEELGVSYEKKIQSTLSALAKNNYSQVIYVSSATVYGFQSRKPHNNRDDIIIGDAYSKIKQQSESTILSITGGNVVRLANVYGDGMSKHNVVNKILSQIPGTEPLRVADQSPVRDFIEVRDVAHGLISLALCSYEKKISGEIYNLGTGIGTSIGILAKSALEYAGEGHRTVFSELASQNFSCLVLDYSETTQICGWTPQISLKKGITELVKKRH